MSAIDPDVDEIIDEQVEDEDLRFLIREILDWESDKLHKTIRQNKKNALDQRITEYIKDT